MTNVYAQGSIGNEWSGVLEDVTDPENPTIQSIQNYSEILVFFRRPDGSVSEVPAEDRLSDDDTTNDMEIAYLDDSAPSILDQIGYWEYTIGVKFSNGTYIKSPYWKEFWVLE